MSTIDEPALLLSADAAPKSHWGRLYGASESLAIAEHARRCDDLLVIIAPSTTELLHLEVELRFFAGADLPVHLLSDWETLTYDRVSPHQDIISQRIRTLYSLGDARQGILLLTAAALMQRLPPRSFLDQHALIIRNGDTLALDEFRSRLVDAGYRLVTQVEEHGEFAVRGSILDLFPMSSNLPYRVEFFDDEIETIRTFDVDTQRGLDKAQEIELLPAHEFPLNEAGIALFRRQYRNSFAAESKNTPIYREVSEGRAPSGIEYYMPLFFEETSQLFHYLPESASFIMLDGAAEAFQSFENNTLDRYEQRRHDVERPILPPAEIYLSAADIHIELSKRNTINTQRYQIEKIGSDSINLATEAPGLYPLDPRGERPMGALQDFLGKFPGRVLFVAESTGRREALLDQLVGNRLQPETVDSWDAFLRSERTLCLTTAALDRGLQLPEARVAMITESQLGSGRIKRRERRRPTRDSEAIISNLTDLNLGAPVVHIDNGVGRYLGLTSLTLGDVTNEYLTIQYAGDDKLYVPVASLHLISRYAGASEESAPLHKLGTDTWQKVRRKAAEKAYDVAAELLEIHARRAARQGFAFPENSDNYTQFSLAFPFEETPDQLSAIEAVVADLRSPQPTDRVVCGDVGFGKTEVAMRAAFVAVDAGKQVVVLVPTTLLARQHHQNFMDRFADWPVQIESLSRFETAKEQKAILKKLESGGVDIIIGTHKLLSKDIKYQNLGLVIIDEEHRFGVRHKEHMKALRSEVDIVTLTATPIPRTLNMGLAGMRDLSIIATPPQHRHAIKTFVGEWSDVQIREACERELARGGQIYFLHNEVQTIERIVEDLERIVPSARINFAHGQMRESDLEQVMSDFYHQRFNILVATTIIESGIDIPSANTILINRADKLGLAQLHQLRGRVGRSHHRAYAYLLTPPKGSMTSDAEKRLQAIESLEDLGVGFTLATHDLEIRGAGELLGEGQSGQIQEIGFTLYSELLTRAVKALKSGKLPDYDKPLAHGTEVDLGVPALLPEDYVPDVHQRLIMYKRISNAVDSDALRELKIELIDRFGLLPPQTDRLFDVMRLRQRCEQLGIERLELNAAGGRIVFSPEPKIDPMALIQTIQRHSSTYRFDGKQVLRIIKSFEESSEAQAFLNELLDTLALPEAA
ncbi:transcription-repair coupling factor [Granulosicoccus antarcticus]|uniref:Transcription-repair-coupling factor n=1 Tax=Granulosicoccus antarcticus IMCC3135 TaxID=1192854 RepID=A0A2Z2NX39_9GAMM|nr:transcription-repair coupling factor [Granulosicoccus antarcticus]ASJ75015.1 Transcription-repair-coupling factor [Granulosicoccus antarcticus IMCC3135]